MPQLSSAGAAVFQDHSPGSGPGPIMISHVPVLIPTHCIIFWPLSRYLGVVQLHRGKKTTSEMKRRFLAHWRSRREGRQKQHSRLMSRTKSGGARRALFGRVHTGQEQSQRGVTLCHIFKRSFMSLTFCVVLHKMTI